MKTISYPQYKRIADALADHIDSQSDPYKYLFRLINGYEYGTRRPCGDPNKLLALLRIKEIWDSRGIYMKLVRLAILRHYLGCSVSFSENESVYVNADGLKSFAADAVRALKKKKEEETPAE